MDWYGYPSDPDVAFFIVSVNQTTLSPYYDDHYDEDRKLLRVLRTFNSSESTFVMEDLPSASEFAAIVYIIDKNNEIIKSERRIFNTEEGGTRFLFHFLTILTMQQKMKKNKQNKTKQDKPKGNVILEEPGKLYFRSISSSYSVVAFARVVLKRTVADD